MWRECTRARYGNNPDIETVPRADGTQRHCKILTLPWLIHQAADSITPEMAEGWIGNCGYSFSEEY